MSAVGFTPIQLFRTTTASAIPTAGSLADGELAINLTDERLYFKNAAGVVKLLASNTGALGTVTSVAASGGTTGLTFSGSPITTSGTLTLGGTLAVANGGTGVTTSTGTGSVVLSNSPTLVTPVLGAATATSIANALGAVGTPSYTFTGDTNTGMWSPAADTLAFSEGGVEVMRINSSANVGIGTTSPSQKLEVVGSQINTVADDAYAVALNAPNGNVRILPYFSPYTGSALISYAAGYAGLGPFTIDASNTRFFTGSTERMRITAAGDVGIGTSSPSAKLHVLATGNILTAESTGTVAVSRVKGTSSELAMYTSLGETGISAIGSYPLLLKTVDTERMRIDSSGNVGIGTSSPADFGRFAVVGSAGGAGVLGINTDATRVDIQSYNKPLAINRQGNNTLLNEGGGNVGIGTSSPASVRLTLNGASGSANGIEIQNSGDTNRGGRIWASGSGASGNFNIASTSSGYGITFNTDVSTERMRIDSSGNLLVGGTTALGRISLQGDTNANLDTWIRNDNSGSSARAGIVLNAFGNSWRMGMGSAANNGNALTWNVDIGGANTERMRIDSSGNVGIGTSSPLAVSGYNTLSINGVSGGALALYVNGTVAGSIAAFSNDMYYDSVDATIWRNGAAFNTAPTERMRIDSSGNLLVGTTSAGGVEGATIYGDGRFFFDCNTTGSSIIKNNSTTAGASAMDLWRAITTGDPVFTYFGTEASFATRGSISYNRGGGVVAYNTTSDYRAKDILGPVENPGATLDALKVYTGIMKGATIARPMLVAHEAQEVVPYAVTGEKDAVNEDGTDKYQQMDHQVLIPLLIAEIQSLRARVAQLEGN